MKCVTIERPADWPEAHIYPLSDWHIGDPNSNQTRIDEVVKAVKDDPYGLAILCGDLCNTAVKTSPSDIFAETASPMNQCIMLVDILQPIKEKLCGAVLGNHELRVLKNDGFDPMRMVCRELGIEDKYCPDGELIFFTFGCKHVGERGSHHGTKPQPMTYTCSVYHGHGGGRREGGKVNSLADMSGVVDADLYIAGHTHMPFVMKENYFRTNMGNHSATCIERMFVNASALLDYGGYGQAQGYKPASTSVPVITLNGTRRCMTATV